MSCFFFTIEIVSNASFISYLYNRLSSFTNFLPEQTHLKGEWEVAISEFSYLSWYQNVSEGLPSTSLDESSLGFEFETYRYLFLDMRGTHLSLKLQLFKGRLFDAFKKERKAKLEEHSDDEPQTYSTFLNNLLHSLSSTCEVYFNNTVVYNAFGLYAHKAQISNEFNTSALSNKRKLACHDIVLKNIRKHLIFICSLI